MKLHFAPKSRALRIVWLLEELGLEYDLARYGLGAAEMRSDDFRKLHPMARVPVLEDGETVLFESGAIVEYVLEKYGDGRLRPAPSSPDYPAYLQWLHYAEGMLMPPVNNYMVETVFLPPERQSEVHAKRAQKLLGYMLAAVDQAVEGKDYLAGAFSGADIMTGSAAMISQRVNIDLDAMPHLKAYINRLQARDGFQKAMAIEIGG